MLSVFVRLTALMIAAILSSCAPAALGGTPDSFAPLVKRVLPAVVNIAVTEPVTGNQALKDLPAELRDTPLGRELRRRLGNGPRHTIGAGSGFVIDPSGIIVTNNHVVGRADHIVVSTADGHQYPAALIGQDPLTDVAVIRIRPEAPLPAVTWGDSRRMEVGDWILSAGNPFGLGGSVTAGIISAEGRDLGSGPFDNFLQIDAPINPGNSGGPVFNMAGQVIGVSSVIVSPSGGSVGIGFAIPSETVSPVVQQLIARGSIARGWLGVSVSESDSGVRIAGMDHGGPAERAGVHSGDIVIGLNGQSVSSSRGLIRAVAAVPPGGQATVTVRRGGRILELPVSVGLRPGVSEE